MSRTDVFTHGLIPTHDLQHSPQASSEKKRPENKQRYFYFSRLGKERFVLLIKLLLHLSAIIFGAEART